MMRRATVFGIALVAWPALSAAQRPSAGVESHRAAHTPGWTIAETMKIRRIEHVRIAPDGRRVLFTVRHALLSGPKGEYRTRLHVANVDGTGERPITAPLPSATDAEWSPDGQWIAFLSPADRGLPGNAIWLIPAAGGTPVTMDGVREVTAVRWSPHGRRIAFTKPARTPAAPHPEAPWVVDEAPRNVQLWTVDISRDGRPRGAARALTPDTMNVLVNDPFGATLDWAPDGSTIAYAHTAAADRTWPATGISLVDVRTGTTRSLVSSRATAPRFSPDGAWIAYIGGEGETASHDVDVTVIRTSGLDGRRLAPTFDRNPQLVGWSADGMHLYVLEGRRTTTRLSALPVSGGAGVDIDAGDAVMGAPALAPSRGLMAFTLQTVSRPMEVYVSPLDRFAPAPVSRVNASPAYDVPRTELVRWTSVDGAEIEGLLTYPMSHREGERHPLVVLVRSGGVAFRQAFLANPFQDTWTDYYPVTELALRGFAVLQCNVRGGALPGYGPDYVRVTIPGNKAYQDVMRAVDRVVEIGVADSARLGIAGLSYGGHLVASVITQTQRFKAAVINAGNANLLAGAALNARTAAQLGAEPWEDIRPYVEHSPLQNFHKVKTPTLVLHGDRDEPVPVTRGYEIYHPLRRLGVPTRMVVYPGAGHPIEAPMHLMDSGHRLVEWMLSYVVRRQDADILRQVPASPSRRP